MLGDYVRILSDGTKYLKTLDISKGLYSKEDIKTQIYPQLIMGANLDYGPLLSVWHCLYNLDFLRKNKIQFDEEVRWSEDNIFSAIVGYYTDSFYYMKGEGLYYYHQNPGTITTSYRKNAWNIYKTMNCHLYNFFSDKQLSFFKNQLKLHLIYYACNCISQSAFLPRDKGIQEIKYILNDKDLRIAFKNVKYNKINLKLRIQLLLMRCKCSLVVSYLVNNRK